MEPLDFADFADRLRAVSPLGLEEAPLRALHAHYRELSRWGARTSLIGRGTAAEVLERHYAESLAGAALVGEMAGRLVDIGSGAGFPGFVLAAIRPRAETVLVESRGRKADFLRAVDHLREVRNRLLQDMTKRIRYMKDRCFQSMFLSVEDRVRAILVRMAFEAGALHSGKAMKDAPTHAEIASFIGSNREAVSRVMSELKKTGVIESGRKWLKILNPNELVDETQT